MNSVSISTARHDGVLFPITCILLQSCDCLFTAAFLSAHFDVCIHSPLAESLPKNKSDFVQNKACVMAVILSKLSVFHLSVYCPEWGACTRGITVSKYSPRIVSHVQCTSLLLCVTCKHSACVEFVCMSMCMCVAVCVWMYARVCV